MQFRVAAAARHSWHINVLQKMITEEIKRLIDSSVLCWLATLSQDGFPSVSPKEAFLHDGKNRIIIANIASPASVANIRSNDLVCVSFIDVFVQKRFTVRFDDERGQSGTIDILFSGSSPSYRLHPEPSEARNAEKPPGDERTP